VHFDIFKRRGDVPGGDAGGESFDGGGLADAGFAGAATHEAQRAGGES